MRKMGHLLVKGDGKRVERETAENFQPHTAHCYYASLIVYCQNSFEGSLEIEANIGFQASLF